MRWLPLLLLPAIAIAQPAPEAAGDGAGDGAGDTPAASLADRPEAKPPPPVAAGSLIPPEAAPAPKAEAPAPDAAVPPPPDAAASPAPDAAVPAATPEQVPPAEGADPAEPEAPVAPAVPAGPPVPETLRDSAFDLSACHLALHLLGARYTVGAAITEDERDCGILQPVHVTEALPGIALEGGAAMRCDTARTLSLWLRDQVVPSAARLPAAPRPVSLALGSTYACRMRVGDSGQQRLSEHAVGNAIDIAAFAFDDGTRLPIEAAVANDLSFAFLKTVQASACLYFTTVLGPGSNAAHAGHLHLDTKERGNGYRLCE